MSEYRTSRWMRWINAAENLILFFIISLSFYIVQPVATKQTLHIPHGSIGGIIAQLTKEGYELSPIDRYFMRFIGSPKEGDIFLGKRSMNRIDFLQKLTSSKAVIHKITLIPGETLVIFFDSLAQKYDLNATKLLSYYHTYSPYPEAGISADTYFVPSGIKEKNLIKFLVRESEKRYKKMATKAFGDYNTTKWQEVLTVASIIQKEAANNKEMPIVASVIYNRLKKRMRLQMDGTLNYGKYSHQRVTPQRIKEDKTTFNTYKHRGLPTSPIGAVSRTAINAALHPAKTDYLYFMKNKKTGAHDFSKDFKSHRKNIQKAKVAR